MYGEEFGSINTQTEPDLNVQQAQIAAASQFAAQIIAVPATGAVGSLNALQGAVSLVGGTNISVASGGTTITVSTSGLGTLATKNQAAAVANQATVASAGYVQAEAQATIDKVNALLLSLRTAGVIGP